MFASLAQPCDSRNFVTERIKEVAPGKIDMLRPEWPRRIGLEGYICNSYICPSLKQSPGCTATFELLNVSMPNNRGRLPKYYDQFEQYPIPVSPWTEGDAPISGRPFVKIYAMGKRFGQDDLVFSCDDQLDLFSYGEFEINDPSHGRTDVEGVHVAAGHDGMCPLMRYKAVFGAGYNTVKRAIEAGVKKVYVTLEKKSKANEAEWVPGTHAKCYCATLAVRCKSGRHRASIGSEEIARILRS